MRNERATELGIEPGVLCSNAALQTLARPSEPSRGREDDEPPVELRKWQKEALGEQRIRAALNGAAGEGAA
jgi:hypothetical protein